MEPKKKRLYPTEIPPFSSIISSLEATYKRIMLGRSFVEPLANRNDIHAANEQLMEYQAFYQTQLQIGEQISSFIGESIKSYRTCLAQYQVSMDGILATIINLQDTFRGQKKTFEALESKLTKQQASNLDLLNSFDTTLSRLQTIPLHESLKKAIARYITEGHNTGTDSDCNSSSGNNSNGRESDQSDKGAQGLSDVVRALSGPVPASPSHTIPPPSSHQIPSTEHGTHSPTLCDCIPVEREKTYWRQVSNSV